MLYYIVLFLLQRGAAFFADAGLLQVGLQFDQRFADLADFILAAQSAKFADTHAKWALTPIWGMSQRLPRRVGTATAKRLMFTAETITADVALEMGLCEAILADETFEEELHYFTDRILANSTFSHAANKRLLEATDCDPMDAGLQWEITENEGVGPDMQDRIGAFMKK